MQLYTAQKPAIIARLLGGEIHIQPWDESAAYQPLPGDGTLLHRHAYEYLAREYHARLGIPIVGAPIFATPHFNTAASALKKKPQAEIITLRAPVDAVLLLDYRFWVLVMLEGKCWEHSWHDTWTAIDPNISKVGRPRSSSCSDACKEASWSGVFHVPTSAYDRQAIMSCIDPGWVVTWETGQSRRLAGEGL